MKKLLIFLLICSFLSAGNFSLIIDSSKAANENERIQVASADEKTSSEGEETETSSEGEETEISSEAEKTEILSEVEKTEILSEAEKNVYHIEPGDVLEIIILGEEELSRTLMVMHNGTISYPLIGELRVAGLTTEDASALLGAKLKKYFTHPVVSIVLKSPTLPYVSIFGEVLRPGAVEYQRGLRVTDYIALAGGPTGSANLDQVKVVRFSGTDPTLSTITVNIIDVNKILKKGITEENYELKAGDWVKISKKFTINWTALIQFATLVVAAINLYYTIDRLE